MMNQNNEKPPQDLHETQKADNDEYDFHLFRNLRSSVERHVPSHRIKPDAGRELQILGSPVHPRIYAGSFADCRTHQSSISSNASNVTCHGVRRKDGASIGKFQERQLAHG